MSRTCSPRQLLFCFIGIFCLFMIFMTGALLRYRLQVLDSRSFSEARRPLQDNLPRPQGSVIPMAPEILREPTIDRPRLTAPGSNYGLSPTECRARFAGLFDEIDRSVALRKDLGNVSSADIDLSWIPYGAMRVMIYNHKLYIIEAKLDGKGHYPRLLAILHQLNRAITSSPSRLPSIEFSFVVNDIADESHNHRTIWAFSRHVSLDDEMWLMPDFGYWSWPLELVGEYEQIRTEMRGSEVEWEKKVPKVLWRGAVKTNKEVRGALMGVTRGKPWADVEEVIWKGRTAVSDGSAALPIAEHCKYQFLVHTEGRSYSGRGKYLLNCASVVITHKAEWIEPHSHLFIPSGPHQNVVEVEHDFSDLEAKVQDLLQNPERAKAIVNNSIATFRDRHITPAAEACYWRQLFLSWADVSFRPEPWEVDENGRKRIRGVPFETFVIEALDRCSWGKWLTLQC
ncbi:hypothetical protein P153DRAFT_365924 [Dothidotthia symphoricarpi CBS 119687]|uniref:Glycosyl transferase CAP10 domain-containing protein n=1 Tax=Dothidotthia symphoricarpi CBS 119687 TaxID=1392245 RepID=A0A6A6AEQ5_9PLEO|nr:uncharacterized protein P153DRAFT_365924 [Dothidotthia symphoricarpi CBS 119687]KAF2130300.1 hypothetical protein P153DRAFT_365924 [Dothidotthia symphoricarpi CBS 119687]